MAPALETSKTADVEKSDIPITQMGDEVKVVGEDRLQSIFKGDFSTFKCCLLTILSHKILSLEFIFKVKVVPTKCIYKSPPVDRDLSRSRNSNFKMK